MQNAETKKSVYTKSRKLNE